jgi:nuclear pore complex protein Nup107
VRGSHVGSYLPSSGVWHRTQRYLKRKNNDTTIVKHVDFDAPTREGAQLIEIIPCLDPVDRLVM